MAHIICLQMKHVILVPSCRKKVFRQISTCARPIPEKLFKHKCKIIMDCFFAHFCVEFSQVVLFGDMQRDKLTVLFKSDCWMYSSTDSLSWYSVARNKMGETAVECCFQFRFEAINICDKEMHFIKAH